jgi:hypothetical protein
MPSSIIRDYSYDDAQRELTIYFVTGRVYVYRDVPEEVFEAFECAPSKGGFFNACIRDEYAFEER